MIHIKRLNRNPYLDEQFKNVLDLNVFIHGKAQLFEYHMHHIKLTANYALLLNRKLAANLNAQKLKLAALAHDLMKERDHHDANYIEWNGLQIPTDNNRYVRMNLDILERYGMDEYFNTDVSLHALAAMLFVLKELKIADDEVLFPIMFHSCPIISVYEKLSKRIQTMVDIIMLSDKLSSNYLRINFRDQEVSIDLDQLVFGPSGNELNYTLGLFMARMISQGKSTETQSVIATEYYHKRLYELNPLITKKYSIDKLGVKKWEKRKNHRWQMPSNNLKK
jgi:HD superfamily phosphohydrolase YqeK